MLIFKKCLCFGLRSGTLTIAWLGMVFFIIDFIYSIGLFTINNDLAIRDVYSTSRKAEIRKNLIYSITFSFVGIIVNATTIYAAVQSIKILLIPWLITVVLSMFYLGIYVMFHCLIIFLHGLILTSLCTLLVGLLIEGIFVFVWLFVFSFYQKIKEDEILSLQNQNAEAALHIRASESFETPPPTYDEAQIYNV